MRQKSPIDALGPQAILIGTTTCTIYAAGLAAEMAAQVSQKSPTSSKRAFKQSPTTSKRAVIKNIAPTTSKGALISDKEPASRKRDLHAQQREP